VQAVARPEKPDRGGKDFDKYFRIGGGKKIVKKFKAPDRKSGAKQWKK